MALAESMAPPNLLLHVAGILLVAGRFIHAYGVSQSPPIMRYRVYGMWLTFAVDRARGAHLPSAFGVFPRRLSRRRPRRHCCAQTAAAGPWCT